MKIDLDSLDTLARADALRLDGLHGDPSKLGGWTGHRDHARCVVALIEYVRRLESWLLDATDCAPGDIGAAWRKEARAVLERGAVLP